MERLETKDDFDAFAPTLTASEKHLFRRGLLAYYGALQCFGVDAASIEYLPRLPMLSTFLEQSDDGVFVGVVTNGRAALIQMDKETVRALCAYSSNTEKPF